MLRFFFAKKILENGAKPLLTGTAPCGAARRWVPGVETWQCECKACPGHMDDTDHWTTTCPVAMCAFEWAQQVLWAAHLQYNGTAAQFWLYGGSKEIQDERVVSTLRGAFYEALPATRARVEADGPTARIETMAEMLRARTLVEIDRDALYVSDEYQLGYGESETAAKRPKTRTDVLTAWRGLAIEVEPEGRIVGTLPTIRSIGTRCNTGGVHPSNYDPNNFLSRNCVHAETKRGILIK